MAGAPAVALRGRPPTLSLLATWLGPEPSTITALVGRLEARGVVAQGPDPRDRRRRRLLLTKTATETVAAIDEQAALRSPCRNLSTAQLHELEGLSSLMQPPGP